MQAFAAFVKNPGSTRFDNQEAGERILFLVRRHWFTQLPRVFLILFLILLPLLLPWPQILGSLVVPIRYKALFILLWYLLVVAVIFESYLNWYFNVFLITTDRVLDLDFWGLLYKNISEAGIDHLEDVTSSQGGIFQSIFDYGDIFVQTAAEKREFEFIGVPRPAVIRGAIATLMGQHQDDH